MNYINFKDGTLSAKLQDGPIKEVGVNGCQIDEILEWCKIWLEQRNSEFPCRENALAITKLEESMMWLEARTKNRIKRGVEGKAQP